jgi:hypothetical protein
MLVRNGSATGCGIFAIVLTAIEDENTRTQLLRAP